MRMRKCIAFAAVLASLLFTMPSLSSAEGSISEGAAFLLGADLTESGFVADPQDATAIFINPAGLAWRRWTSSAIRVTYSYDRVAAAEASACAQGFGVAWNYGEEGAFESRTYRAGIASKLGRMASLGASFKWHHTNLAAENRSPFSVDIGLIARPTKSISLGAVLKNANEPAFANSLSGEHIYESPGKLEKSAIGGISIRPIGERLTLSAQAELLGDEKPDWLFGGRISPAAGLELFGAYRKDFSRNEEPYEEYSFGISLGLGSSHIRAQARTPLDAEPSYGRYSLSIENRNAYVKESLVHEPTFAEMKISGNYLDEGGGFSIMGSSKNLHSLLRELDSARRDEDVKGVLLEIGPLSGAFIGPVSGNLWEIRKAVLAVREAGKPVVAYLSEGGSSEELYLASAADRIVTPRTSTLGMIGVSVEINRMKRLFEKLGIDFDYSTAGDYKSTFHTLYTDTTTALQALELESLVEESYRLLVEGISEGRGIPTDTMKILADGRVFSSQEALNARLIDSIGWKKDAKTELGRLVSRPRPEKLETERIGRREYWSDRWTEPPAVAIVGAYGSIETGKSKRGITSGSRTMGSETVVKQLEAASKYPGVQAIVLRVSSGGGSALASDEILQEIKRIKREKKLPVVVSMGDVAASGGYWISMNADRIFADPFTVTGSIGVVWFKPVFERLYDKLGITNEVFKRGEHSDALSSSRSMTEEEKEMLDEHIGKLYDLFIEGVSSGRKLTPGRVREIGGGRIYLGTQARELMLVDDLGGLGDAVAHAAELAGIKRDYRTIYFKAFPGFFENIEIGGRAQGILRTIGSLFRGTESGFDETLLVY